MNNGNLITTITNVRTGTSYDMSGYVPYSWTAGRYDVSASTTGRDESGRMHKDMIGKSTKYELKYRNLPVATVKALVQLVETSEYVDVTLVDVVEGTSANNYLITRRFYVGDRSYSLYSWKLDIVGEISFSFIEQGVH